MVFSHWIYLVAGTIDLFNRNDEDVEHISHLHMRGNKVMLQTMFNKQAVESQISESSQDYEDEAPWLLAPSRDCDLDDQCGEDLLCADAPKAALEEAGLVPMIYRQKKLVKSQSAFHEDGGRVAGPSAATEAAPDFCLP